MKDNRIFVPITERDLIHVPTDSDTELTLAIRPTMIQDRNGERLGEYTIGITLLQETGTDEDGIMFTDLTPRQARNLIEQLSALIPKVEQLNEIVNG